MKKILLATTVLAAATAAAHAEVTLSGDARMGIITKNVDTTDTIAGTDTFESQTSITSCARVSFTASGATDGGLEFGAGFRADNAGGAAAGTAGSVFVSGAFGKLTVGDVDSAANATVGNVSGVGLTGLGDSNELGYIGGGAGALYTYSLGDSISVAASAKGLGATVKNNTNDATAAPNNVKDADAVNTKSDAFSVAAAYKTDAYTVSLGYELAEVDSNAGAATVSTMDHQLTLGASTTFAGATVKAVYADKKVGSDGYALSVGYSVAGIDTTAFVSSAGGNNSYGIGGSYSLGTGADFKAGVQQTEGSDMQYDAGLSFTF